MGKKIQLTADQIRSAFAEAYLSDSRFNPTFKLVADPLFPAFAEKLAWQLNRALEPMQQEGEPKP